MNHKPQSPPSDPRYRREFAILIAIFIGTAIAALGFGWWVCEKFFPAKAINDFTR